MHSKVAKPNEKANEFFSIVFGFGLFALPCFWGYICYRYLRDGFFPNYVAYHFLDWAGFPIHSWIQNPTDWVGLQKILIWCLTYLGPGTILIAIGLIGLIVFPKNLI